MSVSVAPTHVLLGFAELALEHAVSGVMNTEGPLFPFLLTGDRDGTRALFRYDMSPVDAVRLAQEKVNGDASLLLYAFAADGYLTTGGHRLPAVIVHAGERGERAAFVFAQRFAHDRTPKFSALAGAPETIDATASWFPPA